MRLQPDLRVAARRIPVPAPTGTFALCKYPHSRVSLRSAPTAEAGYTPDCYGMRQRKGQLWSVRRQKFTQCRICQESGHPVRSPRLRRQEARLAGKTGECRRSALGFDPLSGSARRVWLVDGPDASHQHQPECGCDGGYDYRDNYGLHAIPLIATDCRSVARPLTRRSERKRRAVRLRVREHKGAYAGRSPSLLNGLFVRPFEQRPEQRPRSRNPFWPDRACYASCH